MFGMELLDQAGSSFIGKKATALLYWGYKDVYFPGSRTATDLVIPLYGIPNAAGVSAFFYSNGDATDYDQHARGYVRRGKAGKWELVIDGFSRGKSSLRAYIFVDARYIRQPKFGMAVYDDRGVVKFHTARPVLCIKDVGPLENCPYKPATTGTLWKSTHRTLMSGSGVTTLFFDVGRIDPKTKKYVAKNAHCDFLGKVGRYVFQYPTHTIAVIDADYYEKFPNLGNYPQ